MPHWLLPTLRIIALWLVVSLSFAIMKIGYDVVARGYIDLRRAALWELVVLPIGITGMVLLVCRGRRRGPRPPAAPDSTPTGG